MTRRQTKQIRVRDVVIGGDAPITVQSMTKTPTWDVESTVEQIRKLKAAGCEIVRLAVPDKQSAEALPAIRLQVDIPLVADIHFDYKLAIQAVESGIDKIRINPGNIGDEKRIKLVLDACKMHQIPIRIGVNSGSIEAHILTKYGHPVAEAMVESALHHIRICERNKFEDLVISLKSSDVPMMIDAYRSLSQMVDYPLHLGVTEAGSDEEGLIKSAVGIGTLLAEGIGDTIRVSLTDDPVKEVKAGYEILKSLNLREKGVKIVSCPTCGRLEVDLLPIVRRVKEKLRKVKEPLTIAIMGCVVNGPGEAREADIGIACGKEKAILFYRGEKMKVIPENQIENEVMTLIQQQYNIQEI
ncbi:MAG: flavodoxin-dependent (E)-4-hydroxy-3-methylbut-2-enyl-diphosphate synthase [Calditrichia bacterium]